MSLAFFCRPFSVPRSHSGYHITFTCYISLGSSWRWQLPIFLVFDDLDSLEYLSDVMANVPQVGFVNIFLIMRPGLKDHRDKMPFSSHHIKATCHPQDSITVAVDLAYLAKVCQVSPCYSLPHFPYCALWKKATVRSPHARSGRLCSISSQAKYLHKLSGIFPHQGMYLSFLPYLFIQSFIYFSTHSGVQAQFIFQDANFSPRGKRERLPNICINKMPSAFSPARPRNAR